MGMKRGHMWVDLGSKAGDPTGRGMGYSFLPYERALRGTGGKIRTGPVAGSESDYRTKKMSELRKLIEADRHLLEAALGNTNITFEMVMQQKRWDLVNTLKMINSTKFEMGDASKAHLHR